MRTDSPFPISAFFLDIGKKWKLSIDYELFGWRASLILRSYHSRFGTYIYGAPRHPATPARIDASQHGTDELNNNGSYLRGLPPGCSYPCQCPSA